MSTAHTKNSRVNRRSQVFAVLLLAFIYIGQPALAFVAAGSVVAPCQAQGEECCCVEKVDVATPAKSCCSSGDSAGEEHGQEKSKQCDCRIGSGEIPEQAPALPLERNSSAGESMLCEWLRVHSELFGTVECGPTSMLACASARDGTDDSVPRVAGVGVARQVSSVSAWTLMRRGVAGFLAVLSVSRV
jgi:hypothetical protein